MRIHVCGSRGSTPSIGPEFARYGGHTSCLALAHDGADAPTLVLDAGTGLRRVTALLDGAAFHGAVVLTHLHWDHTQGLPFFAAGDRPDADVDVWLPGGVDALRPALSPPNFPITPEDLQGAWRFHDLRAGTITAGGFTVTAAAVPHKGGPTLGLRVSDGRTTLAYLPDHGPVGAGMDVVHEAAMALAADVDLLVHDAQHTADELLRWAHYGHSSADDGVRLGVAAGARRVALFHHGPGRSDDELDALLGRVRVGDVDVVAAADGDVWTL